MAAQPPLTPAFDPDVTYETCDQLRGAAQGVIQSCACLVELAVDGEKVEADRLAEIQRSAQAEIKSIALATQVLVKTAQEWAQHVSEEQYLQVDFLMHCTKRLRKSILSFVGCTKECLSNTLDFLTREKQRTQSQNVVTHTQNVLGVVGILEQQATEYLESNGIIRDGGLSSLLSSVNILAASASHMLEAALAGDSMALVSKLHEFANAVQLLEPKLKDERAQHNLKSLKDAIVAIAQDVNSKVIKFSDHIASENVSSSFRETEFVSFQRMAENGREILAEELINLVLKANESAGTRLPRIAPTTNSGNLVRLGTSERLKQVVDVIEKQRIDSPVVQRRSLAHGNSLSRDTIIAAASKHPSSPLAAAASKPTSSTPPARRAQRAVADPLKMLKVAGDSASLDKKNIQEPKRLVPPPQKRKPSLDLHKKKRKEQKKESDKSEKKKKLELKAMKKKHSRRHSAHEHPRPGDHSDTEKDSKSKRKTRPSETPIPQRDHSREGDPFALVSPRDEASSVAQHASAGKTLSLSFETINRESDAEEAEVDSTPRNASMAMEAAMAAAVPTFVEMFRTEFSWFEKYWKKEGLTRQQEFTRALKNQLVAVMPSVGAEYQPSQPLDVPGARPGGRSNLANLRGTSAAVQEKSEEEAIQAMLIGSQKMKWMRRSSVTHNHLTAIVKLDENAIAKLRTMSATLAKLEASLQTHAVNIMNRDDANFAVEEQHLVRDGNGILEHIQAILGAAMQGMMQEEVEIERSQIVEMACTVSPLGTRDELLVAIANRCDSVLQLREVVVSLKEHIHGDHLVALKSESIQLSAALESVSAEAKALSTDLLLQVLACSRSLLTTFEHLVNQLATYRSLFTYVHRKATAPSQQRAFLQSQQLSAQTEASGEFLWNAQALKDVTCLDDGLSLNEWILSIINPGSLPTQEVNRLRKALYNTSPGVASCAVMINKLREAFRPPAALRGTEVVQSASSFLLKWLEYNYTDLNEHSLALLDELRNDAAVDDMFVAELDTLLHRKSELADRAWRAVYTPIPQPPTKMEILSQAQLLLDTPAVEVARQLTLVDASMLRRLRMKELLAQAWSKDSLKPTAPNVVAILERLNHMSYWVPTVILLFDKLKIRGRATQKFYEIAVELRKLNNFNSLMSIIAGLNNAAASRLKYSLGVVHNALFEEFEKLEAIMSPQKNFAIYRATVGECAPPVIPYIGIYLTDLTYIDENPDKLGSKLNINKKLMISKILEEVKLYQKESKRYDNDLPVDQTLATFLHELPYFGSDRLYKFSLQREPRQASIADIL